MNKNDCKNPTTQKANQYGRMLTIDKTFLSDIKLSWAAKGYWAYLQTKCEDIDTDKLNPQELSLVEELIQCGYLRKDE